MKSVRKQINAEKFPEIRKGFNCNFTKPDIAAVFWISIFYR